MTLSLVGVIEFLLVVVKGGSETAFGVFVHLLGANLEFDDVPFGGDDRGVNGLIAILFGGGNVVFDAAPHGREKRMNDTKYEIASCDVVYDETKRDEVVNTVNVLIVLGKFFVQRINRFDTAVVFEMDMFFLEGAFDGGFGGGEFFFGCT